MAQQVTVGLVGTLIDDNNWPENDESSPVNRRESAAVTSQSGDVEIMSTDNCAGGEVRLISSFVVKLLEDDRTIRFTATLRLFEGTNCQTQDPDGADVTISRNVGDGQTVDLNVNHPGDGGGSFGGMIHVSNRHIE